MGRNLRTYVLHQNTLRNWPLPLSPPAPDNEAVTSFGGQVRPLPQQPSDHRFAWTHSCGLDTEEGSTASRRA